jgi:hypothetical protein
MSRRVWIAASIALIATVAAAYFYVDNRRLRREAARLERERAALASAPRADDPWAASGSRDDDDEGGIPGLPSGLGGAIDGVGRPELPEEKKETRFERRARRQAEVAGMLGRLDGETEEEYRERVMPLVGALLSRPRDAYADMRKQVEEAAGVTEEQRAKLDAAFGEVYDELISYTDGAIVDGQLTPYELNYAGMLEYGGGLGAILTGAEGRIGEILSPGQLEQMSSSGFQWAEYLGVSAPWERLTPPPPPPSGSGS